MGLLNSLIGRGPEVDPSKLQQELEAILTEAERVERAYRLLPELYVFTDRRLILVDEQGPRGKKVQYRSIPYRSITHFSIEAARPFDLDAELHVWLSGGEKIARRFTKKLSVYELQQVLAGYVLR